MGEYKIRIQVCRNATDILNLPCVMGCHKDENDDLVYILYDWDECGQYVEARKGDWLCEDYDGRWHVLSESELQKHG